MQATSSAVQGMYKLKNCPISISYNAPANSQEIPEPCIAQVMNNLEGGCFRGLYIPLPGATPGGPTTTVLHNYMCGAQEW